MVRVVMRLDKESEMDEMPEDGCLTILIFIIAVLIGCALTEIIKGIVL